MVVTAIEEGNLEDLSIPIGSEEKTSDSEKPSVTFQDSFKENRNGSSTSLSSNIRGSRMKAMRFNKSSRNRILSRKLSVVVHRLSGSGNTSMVRDDTLDYTRSKIQGGGILASKADIDMDENLFSDGCKVLLACARGDLQMLDRLLNQCPSHKNFRDYDRRTAMHVAASEGHLSIVEYLVKKGAKINRSDRWGGSPLDDAHRHQHLNIVEYLRKHGGSTGSADQTTYLYDAVANGDVEETIMLLDDGNVNLNEGDYDKRRPLHIACSNGDFLITKALVLGGAKINVKDRWGSTPLDEAQRSNAKEVIHFLEDYGAISGSSSHGILLSKCSSIGDVSTRDLNLSIDISEVEMIERIGAGAFGEIYKCRWKGTLVAAKCIKSAKIQKEWLKKFTNTNMEELPEEDTSMSQTDIDMALEDFRLETAILSKLRHPNICMLLAFTTTQDHEVMISELMKCSLLDVFKANFEQKDQLSKRTQLHYCSQLAKGMNYLHTFKQPIIHRDLKPANLLIDYSGTLKITDFGLAKVRPDPNQEAVETDQFLMTGETGSYRFMAPEVFRHEQYTETVDVYSFAMIVFYIYKGVPPWPNWNGLKAVNNAAYKGMRPQIPREWHAQIGTLLQNCWDENAKGRPSFATIIEYLHDYCRESFGIDCDALTLEPEKSASACCLVS